MVGIDGGHGNYDIYDNRINTSIEPGYGYGNNYYDGNDGGIYGMSNKYDDPDGYGGYGGHGYGLENNMGLRKRNV